MYRVDVPQTVTTWKINQSKGWCTDTRLIQDTKVLKYRQKKVKLTVYPEIFYHGCIEII